MTREVRKKNEQQTLVRRGEVSLTVENESVVAIAATFHWTPTTLIRRIQAALPSKVEQQAFLRLGSDFHIHPESFAKLLRTYFGHRHLSETDLQEHQVAEHLVRSCVSELGDYIEEALDLLTKISDDIEYYDIRLSMVDAGKLVIAYGAGAADVIQEIAGNLDTIRGALRIGHEVPDRKVIKVCIKRIVRTIDEGRVIPSGILETL